MATNSTVFLWALVLLCTCLTTRGRLGGGLLVSETDSGPIVIKFLHRDHILSPLRDPEVITLADRVAKAVGRSHARRDRFSLLLKSPIESVGSESSTSVETDVYAAAGEYVMTGSLGTPPVDFVAIVDTGSDLVWLQCKQCVHCLQQRDPLFDPTKSDTFKELSCSNKFCKDLQQPTCNSTCSYVYGYGDGSYTSGVLASETATWKTTDGTDFPLKDLAFGCGLDDQGDFAGVDGLVGFGRGPLSLPSQIGSQVGREFSYCLGNFADTTNQSSSLVIGKDAKEDVSTFKFTRLIPNVDFPTFYYIHLKSIKVGGERLDIRPDTFSLSSGGTIIDSGTTISYLPPTAYTTLLNHLVEAVAYPVIQNTTSSIGLDLCFNVSGITRPHFPVITFRFSGLTMKLPMENAFLTFDSEGSTLSCLAMGATLTGGFSIIGNYQQQNFQILYDLQNSRLGFKEKKCL